MARFQALHINRLDKKGRASVPAPFRDTLLEQGLKGMYARASDRHPAIECFGRDWADKRQRQIEELDPNSIEYEDSLYGFFGKVHELTFDAEGRVLLPGAFVAHARLADRVAFIGLGSHFAIWEPQSLDAFMNAGARREAERLPRAPGGAQTGGGRA
jgi:MraZ protein